MSIPLDFLTTEVLSTLQVCSTTLSLQLGWKGTSSSQHLTFSVNCRWNDQPRSSGRKNLFLLHRVWFLITWRASSQRSVGLECRLPRNLFPLRSHSLPLPTPDTHGLRCCPRLYSSNSRSRGPLPRGQLHPWSLNRGCPLREAFTNPYC